MIKKEDIKRAINLFKQWDNYKKWDVPSTVFKHHTLKKSQDARKTARILLEVMENEEASNFFDTEDYDGTLWIINSSYYRIFFLAQYLLALDNKKLPKNTEDTHKTVELALMYYFIIKGSNLENKKDLEWEDIKDSRLSKALLLMEEAEEESRELTQQKAKSIVENMESERRKRQEFTYNMNFDAELKKAKTSIDKATQFEDIIRAYISVKKLR